LPADEQTLVPPARRRSRRRPVKTSASLRLCVKNRLRVFIILCGLLGAVLAPGRVVAETATTFPNSKASIRWRFDADAADVVTVKERQAKAAPLYPDAPLRFAPGLFGRALDVSFGRSAVETAHDEGLDLTDDFSVECVVCLRELRHFRTVIMKGVRTCQPERINYTLSFRDGKPEFKFKDRQGDWLVFSGTRPVESGQWVWVRFSVKDGKVRLWLNGQPEKLSASDIRGSEKTLVANTAPLLIGSGITFASDSRSAVFDGLIDHITVYDGALDEPEPAEKEAFAQRLAAYQRDGVQEEWLCRELEQKLQEHCSGSLNKWQAAQVKEIRSALQRGADETWQAFRARLSALDTRIAALAADIHYCRLADADGGPCPVVMGTAERWFKEPCFFKAIGTERKRRVDIEAARGEYEGFQVALLAPARHGFENIGVEVEELKGSDGAVIPATNIEWGWIRDITTEWPDIPVPFVGPIPDAIMEGERSFDVVPGSFTPVYFRVGVDRDAKPGVYKGGVVFVSGGQRVRVPVTLKVRNFTLPVRASLKMAFSFFEGNYRKWYKHSSLTEEQQRYLYEFLLKYRISPNNIYDGSETYPARRFLEQYHDQINFFTYGGVPSAKKPLPEETLKARVDRAVKVHEWVKEKGMQEAGYVYLYDELGFFSDPLDAARQVMGALHKAMPDAKFMQTSFPDPRFDTLFNVWCPLFEQFSIADRRAKLEEKRREGHEIWWYAADNPSKPYPNFFLDHPVFDCRIIATLSWMYKVDGVLYWCINREWATNVSEKERWPEGEWKPWIYSVFSGKRVYKNGMGNFVYPGPDGRLLPSLRLENLRDGVEDYDYLCLLRDGIEKLRQQNGNPDLLARAEAVLVVPPSVARAVNDYASDPSHLLAWRTRLADMIEELAAVKGCE